MGGNIFGIRVGRFLNVPLRLLVVTFLVLSALGMPARGVNAAPAGTALNFDGTNEYVTFGQTRMTPGNLTNSPSWNTEANSRLGASSLTFNGTNNYVTFGNASELGLQHFTIETWFYRTGTGIGTDTSATGGGGLQGAIPLVTKGRGEADYSNKDMNYFLGIASTGVLAADFEDMESVSPNPNNHAILGTTTISLNTWYHAAATYDGTAFKLYLNGYLEASVATTATPRWDSIQHAGIATGLNSGGTAGGFFAGRMDEVRIWNVARTQEEILASMNSEILVPTDGLVGRWGLNDTSGTTASNLNRLGVTSFTIEAWIKRSSGGGAMSTGTNGFDNTGGRPYIYPVVTKGMGEGETPKNINTNWFLGITSTGVVGADFEDTASGLNHPAWGSTPIPVGEWHHIAATYDGSCWDIYVDGNLDSLDPLAIECPNATPESTSYQQAGLAAGINSTGGLGSGFFAGIIDEVRVWNRALDLFEIQSNLYSELISGDGLIARWGMNESSGTTITSDVGTFSGTLTNGPTWVTGFPDNVPPGAPTKLAATGIIRAVYLTWEAPSDTDIAGYNIFRGTESGVYNPTPINGVPITDLDYQDVTGLVGTTYYYIVRAVDTSSNQSDPSNEASATPQPDITPPAAPTGLTATPGNRQVSLSWTAPSDPDVMGYNVFRSETSPVDTTTPINLVLVTDVSYNDTGLTNGTRYYYVVTAVDDSENESDPSNEVNAAPSSALQFTSASNTYVTFGDPAKLDLTTFTIETWFKRTGSGTPNTTGSGGITNAIPLVTHGSPEDDGSNVDANWMLVIDDDTDVIAADFEDMATGSNHPVRGVTPIGLNEWHHAAATYDGTTWRLYLDGNLEITEVEGSYTPRYDSIQRAGLGTMIQSGGATNGYFQGVLDEARVWNRALSQSEILNNINQQITSGSGLVARWGLEEGTGTTVGDSIAPAATGTITGSNYAWVPGAPFNLPPPTPPSAPSGLTVAPSGSSYLTLSWTDNSTNESGFEVERSTSGSSGPYSLLTTAAANATSHSDGSGLTPSTEYCYRIRAVNAAGQSAYAGPACGTTLTESASALQFDGSNDYVTFGVAPGLGVTNFTLETWFYWTGSGVTMTTSSTQGLPSVYPLISKGRGEADGSNVDMNFFLGIDSATKALAVDFEDTATGMNYPFVGTTPVTLNTWHHAAVTYDSATAVYTLYLDGVPAGTKDLGSNILPRSDSIQHAGLATAMTSTGSPAGYFEGYLDEARIWNVARTQAEIRATINQQVYSGSGLVARWGLSEGSGTIAYSSVGAFPGTLTNGPVWITPGAPFNIVFDTEPPAAPTGLVATGANASVALDWADNSEPDLAGYNVYRANTPGGPFTKINSVLVNVSAYNDTGLTNGIAYYYVVTALDSSGNESAYSNETYSYPMSDQGAALEFTSASGTYVTFGDPSKLDLAAFTIETWFKRTGAGTAITTGSGGIANAIPLVAHGAQQAEGGTVDANWMLVIDDSTDVIAADFEDTASGQNHPVLGVTPITDNIWHHAAAAYDGSTWTLYLDGRLEASLFVGASPRSDTTQHASLGTMLNATGGTNGFFQGVLDEARVWNRALTQNEILANINRQITEGSGLVARWGMDEGGGTTVSDSIIPIANGTINGLNYAWVPGAPFDLDVNPSAPVLVEPANGATGVSTSATLSVSVDDPVDSNLTVSFYGRPKEGPPGDDFTLIAIPDPQYYASTYPSIYYAQMNWVVAEKTARNIAYVLSLGDNVDDASSSTQWDVAKNAWDILTTGNVPYGLAVGNHDGAPSNTANFNSSFGSRLASQPLPVTQTGHYGTDWDNSYALFTASGMDFIVIYIEYDTAMTSPSHAVLAWANNLLAEQYPDRRAIIVTHNLLSGNNFTGQGQAIYDALKANPNLFLMLGGHLDTTGQRSDTYNGNTVYSLRSDYQFVDSQQSGYLRIMRFSPANNRIYITTYSPTQSKYLTDTANQFDLTYPMASAPEFTLIGTDTVPAGETARVTWSGLDNSTEYEWYAVASNGAGIAASETWSFTTEASTNQPPVITQGDSTAVTMSEDGSPTPFSLTLDATDPNPGDTLTWSIATLATHGTATASGTGSSMAIGYAPAENYNGSDSFVVQVSDGHGGTDSITVNVTIEPVYDALGLSCVTLDPKPMTAQTSDKPQSKVWLHDGSWYAVFPTSASGASSAGTWVWKLVGTTWTEMVKLSTRTDTHADVKVDGNLAHIILWAGTNTQLATIQYTDGVYQLWETRPALVDISLADSETATIDLDSTGRMWLAARTSTNIVVYYSDSPYSTWSGPVVLASGVNADDIPAITALPGNKIGVLWSNQNTKRFGFKMHTDGADPAIWSADEVPASQSANDSVGTGMADDHINLAVSSDGTLYAAVKTGYDTSTYPKMALLVRRPAGTWDDLYMVDDTGTRPLILLDETNGVLTYVYTQSEGFNPIVYRQSLVSSISFDSQKTLRTGSFNEVSSTKSTIDKDFVVIYSSSSEVAGQRCYPSDAVQADLAITKTDGVTAVLPGSSVTYTITAANSGPGTVSGAAVADDFPEILESINWTCTGAGGGQCSASGSGDINDLVNLPVGGSVTYIAHATVGTGATGNLVNTAVISSPNETVDLNLSNNAATDTDIVGEIASCETNPNLVGCWPMEEGSGTLLADGSGHSNHATLYGSPTWVTGIVGTYALDLNGTSQYAAIPDNSTLDLTTGLTLATWIKPEQYATQDLIKKAVNGGVNGYELSLATTKSDDSSQRPFFRINQVASGDTYRINAQTMYPTDGSWMHVAATYDGATMKLYINGVLERSMAATVPIATNDLPLTLGAQDGATASRWFMGWMDDVRVYNRALTAEEIRALPEVSQTISGNVGVAGAVLNYDDGGPKSVTADGSGNYTISVPYSWSGTVTPLLAGYTFTPASRTYTQVISDQSGQNYTATQEPIPPLPSSFYGEIHYITGDGEPIAGDKIFAHIPGLIDPVEGADIGLDNSTLIYSIDVPGDMPETVGVKEGGVEGETVTFKINGRVVATGVWHSGTNTTLDIHPPAANAGGPYVGVIVEEINFSASAADWLTTDTFNYAWDLDNDGAYDNSSDQNPTHSFSAAGIHTVGLKATDSQGGEGTAATDVVVVGLTGLTGQTYDGTQKSVTVSGNIDPYTYTITYNGSATAPTNAGSYTVVVTIKNGEVVVGTITKTMVISPKLITITPDSGQSKVIGDPDPVLTYTYSPNDPQIAFSGALSRVSGESPGTYSITIGTLSAGTNYTLSLTPALFTILAKHSIALVPGWNLVSFNVHPTSTAVADVLASVSGNFDLVYAWDASAASGSWLKYDNVELSPDTLTDLDETMGFWIHMTAADTLEVTGSLPATTNIDLHTTAGGWNLVGYPANVNHALPGALEDHGVEDEYYTYVYAYHAGDAADPWKLYDSNDATPPWVNDLTEMAPGWGYWIYVSAAKTWEVVYAP